MVSASLKVTVISIRLLTNAGEAAVDKLIVMTFGCRLETVGEHESNAKPASRETTSILSTGSVVGGENKFDIFRVTVPLRN